MKIRSSTIEPTSQQRNIAVTNAERDRRSTILPLLVPAILFLLAASLAPWQRTTTAQEGAPFPPAGHWRTYANADYILALLIDRDVLWAATRAGGVTRWDTGARTFTQYLSPQDDLAGNVVYDIAIDANGFKWFATEHGLSLLDDNGTAGKDDDVWHTYTRQNTSGGLPSNHVTAVAVDEAGFVWVGSSQYWDPEAETWVGGGLSKLDTKGTLDPADDVWLHTYTLENTRTIQSKEFILGLASNNITDILPVPGDRLWIATRQHWVFEQPDENIPPHWIEAHGGLSRLDHAGTTQTDDDDWETWNCEEDSQFGCVATQLRRDHLGYVWAAMRGRGVLFFRDDATTLRADRDRFTSADGLASDFVDAIAFGSPDDPEWANTVWFSTYQSVNGQGLGVSVVDHNGTPGNRSDDTWNTQTPTSGQPITTANGLAGNRVLAMVAGPSIDSGEGTDTATIMWLGTGGSNGAGFGISPFDLAQKTFGEPLLTTDFGPISNYITDLGFGQPGTRWENHVWVTTGSRWERRHGAGVSVVDTRGTLDPGDDVWSHFTKASTDDNGEPPWTGLGSNNVVAVAVDGDRVWFGSREVTWDGSAQAYTDGGLSLFDGDHWTLRTTDNAGLRSNRISTLAPGCDGELWIALGNLQESVGDGIDRLETGDNPHNPTADTWLSSFRQPPLPSNLISDVVPDCGRERVWVANVPNFTGDASQGGGIARYDYGPANWTVYTKADGLQSYTATGITGEARSLAVAADGTVWAGTWGTTSTSRQEVISDWPYVPAVVNWYRDGNWTGNYAVFPHDGWVSSLAVDEAGVAWATTSRGGMDIDQDGQPEDEALGMTVGGLKLTLDGTDWVTWTPENSDLVTNDIEVVAVAPNGDVWLGTNGWGLMHFHREEPTTPTPTLTPTTRIPATVSPTPTATSTATAVLPTATATVAGSSPQRVYLPLVAGNWVPQLVPTATATPIIGTPASTSTATPTPTTTATSAEFTQQEVYLPLITVNSPARVTPTATVTPAGPSPQFTCGGWCSPGSSPGTRRQVVTADRPVERWRWYLDELGPLGLFVEPATSTRAVVDAPEGSHVRIEASFEGKWILACESDVTCAASVSERSRDR